MLIERRSFACTMGDIGSLVDDVLALDRSEEVLIIFNDLIVPVFPDDVRNQVLTRWNDKRLALVAKRQA